MTINHRRPIPRPSPSRVPPPPASGITVKPGVASARGPMPTVDLEDSDIVGISVPPMSTRSSAPPPARSSAPPPPVSVRPPPVSMRPSAPPPPVSVHSSAPPPAPPAAVRTEPPAAPVAVSVTPVSVPPPQPLRLSVNDPTDLLFDKMYGLTFAPSLAQAAEICAETLAIALGARSVIVHRRDLRTGELRALGAYGDGDFDIIGTAEPSEEDLVAAAVLCNQKAVTMKFDGELSRVAPKRLHAVGAPRTLVAAPAISWGRCLAIIEVIDADERYAPRVADAAAYVAQTFAKFLAQQAA